MKICIAQTKSKNGNIKRNIENHVEFIERAIKFKFNFFFPRLSIFLKDNTHFTVWKNI